MNTNPTKNDAAIKITRFLNGRKKQVNELNTRISELYDHIFGIMNRIDISYMIEVISQDKYNDYMNKMENVVNIYTNITKPVTYLTYKRTKTYVEFLETIIYDLCMICGASNLIETLEILVGYDWIYKVSDTNMHLVQYYNLVFTPTSCIIINENKSKNILLDTLITKELTSISDSLLENIQGAELCIPVSEEILVVSGYFKKDSLNISRIGGDLGLGYKNNIIKDALDEMDVPIQFRNSYLDGLSLRDFIVLDRDTIIDRINASYNRLEAYKKDSISNVVKDFISSNIEVQRDILTLFLLDESSEKTEYLAHLIYDILNVDQEQYRPYPTIEKIYKSLQWPLQKIFLKNIKIVKKYTEKILNNEDSDVPYEKRIKDLDTSDYIKSKAFDKLKEYRQNRDGSYKPQQYLDGLLRIPFGIYRKEYILIFLEEFKKRLEKYFKALFENTMNYLNENVHDSKELKLIEELLDITEDYNKSKYTTEREINDFMKKLKEYITNYKIRFRFPHLSKRSKKYKNPMDESIESISSIISPVSSPVKLKEDVLEMNSEEVNSEEVNSEEIKHDDIYDSNLKEKTRIKIKIEQKNKKKDFLVKTIKEFSDQILEWINYKKEKKEYIINIRNVLNSCVHGHKNSKHQLEMIIGQWIHGKMDGAILGIKGPPGTGKTTLCKKGLAKCLVDDEGNTRPFSFIALGGTSNGSTLEGHGYTYVGSTWGKVVDILMETKCMNPIIYIDELDKVSRTEQGREIIGILTHLTDSAQNTEFQDKYFSGVKLDLSKALIVFSYNDSDYVDKILLDRIIEITINPLTKSEKIEIIKKYVLPEILESVGYKDGDYIIEKDEILFIIENYTMEAGVRKLKEKLYEIVRDINIKRIMGEGIRIPVKITQPMIKEILSDNQIIVKQKIPVKPHVGLMNGLYATSTGVGGIIIVEAFRTLSDTKLGLELTGQQGDVMKESVKCAKTIAWNLLPLDIKNKIREDWKDNGPFGLHVHCPEAGTPKDGPSAGGAITIAILSQLSGVPIKNKIAMTGEIDLNGSIRQIGGLQSKLEGARSAGVELAIIPKNNEDDLNKLPNEIKKGKNFEVVMVNNIFEALKYALVDNNLEFNE